jgi:hypothetical protein
MGDVLDLFPENFFGYFSGDIIKIEIIKYAIII